MALSSSFWWATLDDLDPTLVTDSVLATELLAYSSFVMWSLTGKRYGPVAEVTEMYDTTAALAAGSEIYPILRNGSFYNCGGSCKCSECGITHRLRLRGTPVRYIAELWVDGTRLDKSCYTVLDNSVLALLGDGYCCAKCVTVRYGYGTGVPPGGKMAVKKLTEEMLSDLAGGPCRLPKRVTSVNRQGMSWTLLDPQEFLDQGRTGVYEIDLLLRALNPAKALAPARVFSPDIPRGVTTVLADPPLSTLLNPNDFAVVAGDVARWVTHEDAVITKLQENPTPDLSTRVAIANTPIAAGKFWRLLVSSDSTAAYLDVDGIDTADLEDQTPYEIVDDVGNIYGSGLIRVIG